MHVASWETRLPVPALPLHPFTPLSLCFHICEMRWLERTYKLLFCR